MVPIPVAGVVIRQGKIVSAFRAAGATARERATSAGALAIHEGLAFRILCRHEILRDAGEHRLWLDEPRWAAHERQRHRIALRIIGTMLLLMVALGVWLAVR